MCPGLHQKNCDQQVKGDDSAPLLPSFGSLTGVMCPDLVSSAKE